MGWTVRICKCHAKPNNISGGARKCRNLYRDRDQRSRLYSVSYHHRCSEQRCCGNSRQQQPCMPGTGIESHSNDNCRRNIFVERTGRIYRRYTKPIH